MKRFSILILILSIGAPTVKAQFTTSHAPKNVSIEVKLLKDSVALGAAIPLTITLTNTGKAEQKLLLDKPKATGSPWGIWASITNLKTKQQAVMYQSRAIFSNTFYTEDKLKDDYYTVKPGESISAGYDLLDVVMVSYRERYLPKGDYELQVTYYKAVSKKLKFTVL